MNQFLIAFSLLTCLMMKSSIGQNSRDVSIKWSSPKSHLIESGELKTLSFEGAFYNLNESSFPFYKEKIRLPQNVSEVEVNIDVQETSPLLSSEKNLLQKDVPVTTLRWNISYERKIPYLIFTYIPLSEGFNRINQNQVIKINGIEWTVKMGNGHAPEHATFWSKDIDLVIAGDQILPGISSNLGVYALEPNADTVGDWIESCKAFLEIATDNYTILPGHGKPFSGLLIRLNQLIENHNAALQRIRDDLALGPKTAVELFKAIFKRDINKREYMLALGEAVGHMNHLYKLGEVERDLTTHGAYFYSLKT